MSERGRCDASVDVTPAGQMPPFWTVGGGTVPVALGGLVPDSATAVGSHRKTFHNRLVLAGFIAFPLVVANLRYGWLGVLIYYVLDGAGTTRGIALFYPFPGEYDLPIGIPISSRFALVVTLCITAGEIALVGGLVSLSAPIDLPALSLSFSLSPVLADTRPLRCFRRALCNSWRG